MCLFDVPVVSTWCLSFVCVYFQYLESIIFLREVVYVSRLFCGQSQLLRYTCCAKKKCCALQENVVSKQLTLYDQETTDQYVVDCKVSTV